MAPNPERLLSVGLQYNKKSLLMIYKIKVSKKGAFMITIIIFVFSYNSMWSVNDVLAGNCDRFSIERSN